MYGPTTFLPSIVPAEAALKTPTSLTVTPDAAVNVFVSWSVSLVNVVVVLETVAADLPSPVPPAFSAPRAVSPDVAAAEPDPVARYVNAVGETTLPMRLITSALPALTIRFSKCPVSLTLPSASLTTMSIIPLILNQSCIEKMVI